MNRDHELRASNAEIDALNAYLDRLVGVPDEQSGPLSLEMRGAVDRLFALSAAAEQGRPAFQPRIEPAVSTPPIQLPPIGHRRALNRAGRVRHHIRHWAQPMHMLSTAALVIVTVTGVILAATIGNGHHDSNGTHGGVYGAVPNATVPENAITSSLPYPTAAECTATPRSKDDVARILHTPPDPASILSAAPPFRGPVDQTTATAVMNTYRRFQACAQKGSTYAYSASIVTEEEVRVYFYGEPRNKNDHATPMSGVEIAHQLESNVFFATPAPWSATQPQRDGTALTIFPDDIEMRSTSPVGATNLVTPTSAPGPVVVATAYPVDLHTREVTHGPPMEITFVNVEGQWLINHIGEKRVGGLG